MNTISKTKLEAWFNKYCMDKKIYKNTIAENGISPKSLAYIAASLSYRASVLRALNIGNKKEEASQARKEGEQIIADFLFSCYNSAPLTVDIVAGKWEQIRTIYKQKYIDDYTYGNAQKWVNMSIKYYIALLSNENLPCESLMKIPAFPVDGIMINHIKRNLKISFPCAWSKCDNKADFIEYLNKVNKSTEETLFEFELNAWS